MARLTVTVEGEAQEVREALLRLLNGDTIVSSATSSGLDSVPDSTGGKAPEVSPQLQLPWTKEELAQFWPYLTAPAQRVLGEIATQPDGYRFEELAQTLGSDMRIIGGNLASVGHAMRRLHNDGESFTKSRPHSKDAFKRVYRMEEDVAAWIREFAAQDGSEDVGARGGK